MPALVAPEMRHLPVLLVGLRLVCAPALLAMAWWNAPDVALAAVMAVAFVSDVFDCIVARRLGVATEALRRADSVVDTVFYVAATGALFLRRPAVLRTNAVGIAVVVVLELVRQVVDRIKFGKAAAYHMWSAKLWGVLLFLGFAEVFLRRDAGLILAVAIIWGVASQLEGLAASLVLTRWRHDVPSIVHAFALEREARRTTAEPLGTA